MAEQYVEYMLVPNSSTGVKEKRYIRDKAAQTSLTSKADKSSTVSTVTYDSTNKKITKTINGTTSDVVTAATLKTAMSLNNVDNKSSSTIRGEITSSNVTSALGYTPINPSTKGAANGVASLDETGKVPSSQLPSYVDDVIEGYYYNSKFYKESAHATEITGEAGKIYVDLTSGSNSVYRWSGSAFAAIPIGLALGTTSSTAYRGDYGNTAYSHASSKGSAFSSGLYKITTNAEGHVTAATAVQKSDITGLGIPGSDTTYTFDGTYNASTNKAATVSTVTNAISALDGNLNGTSAGSGKTLTGFSQTDGKINATFGNISITKSQVSDFPTLGAAAAKGVTDNSAPTAVSSTDTNLITGRTLYNAGYTKNTGTITGITMNGVSKGTSGVVDLGTVITSHQSISGKKNTQSAVSDPTASGTSLTFIDSISQDAQGVITPTKKTVSDMSGASASSAGTHGLVPAPAAGKNNSFLRGDGTWATPYGGGTVTSVATGAGLTGGTITGSGTIKANLTSESKLSYDAADGTETNGKIYPVRLDKSGKLAVNVPWLNYSSLDPAQSGTSLSLVTTGEKYTWNNKASTDVATTSANGLMSSSDKTKLNGIAVGATANTGTVTSVATGAGITGGIITESGTIKANLTSETKLSNAAADGTETSGRVYPVRLDKDGKLAVNVPWTDTTSFVPTTRKVNGKTLSADITLSASDVSAAPSSTVSCTTANVKSALGTGSGTSKFLREDGTWVTPAGGGTVISVGTGAGLTGGTITGSGTIKADLTSETKLLNAAADGTETSGRVYPVRLDANGKLAVNVPWVAYSSKTAASGGTETSLVTTGEKYTWNNKASTSTATTSANGLMSSSDKTKLDGITAITNSEIDALFT